MEAQIGDYQGRSVDLLMMDGMHPTQETLLTQALASETSQGAVVAGVQKLVQRFLLELLTELGSIQYLPTRGSLFMLQARLGYWRTAADIESSFYAALLYVKRNLQQEETREEPADERFSDAILEGVELAGDWASIRVRVVSRAGDDRVVLAPLRVSAVS